MPAVTAHDRACTAAATEGPPARAAGCARARARRGPSRRHPRPWMVKLRSWPVRGKPPTARVPRRPRRESSDTHSIARRTLATKPAGKGAQLAPPAVRRQNTAASREGHTPSRGRGFHITGCSSVRKQSSAYRCARVRALLLRGRSRRRMTRFRARALFGPGTVTARRQAAVRGSFVV